MLPPAMTPRFGSLHLKSGPYTHLNPDKPVSLIPDTLSPFSENGIYMDEICIGDSDQVGELTKQISSRDEAVRSKAVRTLGTVIPEILGELKSPGKVKPAGYRPYAYDFFNAYRHDFVAAARNNAWQAEVPAVLGYSVTLPQDHPVREKADAIQRDLTEARTQIDAEPSRAKEIQARVFKTHGIMPNEY